MRTHQVLSLAARIVLLSLAIVAQLAAQEVVGPDPKTEQLMAEAKKAGFQLKVDTPVGVSEEVKVEAVLIPYASAKSIFGKVIAKHYAVVHVNISNESSDQALLLQDVFADYREWILSGIPALPPDNPALDDSEAAAIPGRIGSAEMRLVRGQLFDKRPWTPRNLGIGALRLIGEVASGFAFSITSEPFVRSIGAYNGTAIPALERFVPDPTIEQANRISDLGYRINRAVPKESSAVVVAFFPINRFLSEGLKKIFIKSPALFFSPLQIVIDPVAYKLLEPSLLHAFPEMTREQGQRDLINAAKCYMAPGFRNEYCAAQARKVPAAQLPPWPQSCDQGQTPQTACELGQYLEGASLNNVRVMVRGVMTVNVASVPASILTIEFDGDTGAGTAWTAGGEKTGTIRGTYLADGEVEITNAEELGIKDVATVASGSSATELKFKFTIDDLSKLNPGDNILKFRVNKKDEAGNTVLGVEFEKVVQVQSGAPSIASVSRVDGNVTVSGKGFQDPPSTPLAVTLHPTAGDDVPVPSVDRTADTIAFDLTALPAGCWSVRVEVGHRVATRAKDVSPFFTEGTPEITAANFNSDKSKITVTGTDLIDLSDCSDGPAVEVQLIAQNATAPAATRKLAAGATQIEFTKPATPANAVWQVRLSVKGAISGDAVTVQ